MINIPLTSTFKNTGFKQAEKSISTLDKSANRLAMTLASAFSARALGRFTKTTIMAASRLEESMSKVNVVFARGAAEVESFGRSSAASLGLSSSAALEAAGTYGNLLQAFGIGQREAQGMSLALVKLAADMASFNNTSIDQAITALRSGLSGETEPLKRYGVALQDVRLRTEALRLGLVRNVREALTPAVKAQAAYALIMKDTALAQGDFERTAGGVANSLRIISASAENAQAIIGEKLIRSMDLLVDREEGVAKVAVAFESMATNIGNAAVGLASIGRVVTTLGGLLPGSGASILDFKANIPGLIGFQQLVKLGQKDTAQQAAKKAAIDRANAKEQGMLASRNLGTQRKTTKELEKQSKIKKESNKLAKAEAMFDDERISIEAALQGNLTDNERLRLQLLKAIANENEDRADALTKKLKESQEELALLRSNLTTFKPANPFQEWEDALARIRAGLGSVGVPVGSSIGSTTGGNTGILATSPNIPVGGSTSYNDGSLTKTEERMFGVTEKEIGTVNVYVSGTGGLDDQAKRDVVDAVVEASSRGYGTGWFRTTDVYAI